MELQSRVFGMKVGAGLDKRKVNELYEDNSYLREENQELVGDVLKFHHVGEKTVFAGIGGNVVDQNFADHQRGICVLLTLAESIHAVSGIGETGGGIIGHFVNTAAVKHHLIVKTQGGAGLHHDLAGSIQKLHTVAAGRSDGKPGGFLAQEEDPVFLGAQNDIA